MKRQSKKRRARVKVRVKKERQSLLLKARIKQVEAMQARISDLRREQLLVKSARHIAASVDNPSYRTWPKLAAYFDYLFVEIEPDPKKRKQRLSRIFKYRPTVNDTTWIRIMIRELKVMRRRSRMYGIKERLM